MASEDLSVSNFGVLIAYVIPGFLALRGLPFPGGLATWSGSASDTSVAGLLSSTFEAVFAGLAVSTLRWLTLDALHHRTRIRPPAWNFGSLESRTSAFDTIVSHQYNYYKFYANSVVALAFSYCTTGHRQGWFGLAYFLLMVLFFLGSRDTLRKYYRRGTQLLGEAQDPVG